MKLVGFPATCSDGILEIKEISKYISKLKGGEGVFRDVVDLILKYKLQ
jgi:3-deoxy-D-manno-octulosonate 8-phosphate phosphatase (KDO 8-P phosphatase)